jgi:hypothetical protein
MCLGERNGNGEVAGSSSFHRTVFLTNILFLPLKIVLKKRPVFFKEKISFPYILPNIKPECPKVRRQRLRNLETLKMKLLVMVIYTIYPIYSLMMQIFLPPLSFSSPSARGRPSDIGMIRIRDLRFYLIPPTPASTCFCYGAF